MKIVRWLALNGALGACLYFAVTGAEWAANVVRFAVWAMLVLYLMAGKALVTDKKADASLYRRHVPRWLTGIYDFGFCATLAAVGWFWTAGAFLFSVVLIEGMHLEADRRTKATAPAEGNAGV